MPLVELREYRLKEGKLQEWLVLMEAEIIPYQLSKGMKVISTNTYSDEQGNDWFIWLREFENEAKRQEITQLTYNEWWKTEIRPKIFQLIEKDSMRVRVLQNIRLK